MKSSGRSASFSKSIVREFEAREHRLVLGEVRAVVDLLVAAERHVEAALAVESTQAVVSGSIQVVEQRRRFRRVALAGLQQLVEALTRRVVRRRFILHRERDPQPPTEPSVEIDHMWIDVIQQRRRGHQSQCDREPAAKRLDEPAMPDGGPTVGRSMRNLPSFPAGPLQRRTKRGSGSSEGSRNTSHVGREIERCCRTSRSASSVSRRSSASMMRM